MRENEDTWEFSEVQGEGKEVRLINTYQHMLLYFVNWDRDGIWGPSYEPFR